MSSAVAHAADELGRLGAAWRGGEERLDLAQGGLHARIGAGTNFPAEVSIGELCEVRTAADALALASGVDPPQQSVVDRDKDLRHETTVYPDI